MKRLLLLSLLVFTSLSIGCSRDRDYTTEAAREPESTLTDSELEKQILAKINSDEKLNMAGLSVDADVEQNTATLTGTVESEDLRTRAVQLASATRPGLFIQDKVDVKPREFSRSEYTPEMARGERERAKQNKETIGDSLDDAWIHAKIVTKLVSDWQTPERKINVDVKDNVVTLRGTVVAAEQKTEAERIAKETDGVKRVINQIKVTAN